MKELTEKDAKALLVEGLCEFDKICKENGLSYYLIEGSLLGAARHKGFIPWDDDIDVCMFRDDYMKLLALSAEEKTKTDDWNLISAETEPKFLFYWAKFCSKKTKVMPPRFMNGFTYGVSIDVFPLDTVSHSTDYDTVLSETKAAKKKWTWRFAGMWHLFRINEHRNIKTFLRFIYCRLFFGSVPSLNKKFNRAMSALYDKNVPYVCSLLSSPNIEHDIYEREWFKVSELEFEGHLFPAPKKYHEVLTKRYGDYMELPPRKRKGDSSYWMGYIYLIKRIRFVTNGILFLKASA